MPAVYRRVASGDSRGNWIEANLKMASEVVKRKTLSIRAIKFPTEHFGDK
jgi:hypothetical protein